MPNYPGTFKKRDRWYYRFQVKKHRYYSNRGYTSAKEAYTAELKHRREIDRQSITFHNLTLKQLCIKYLEEYETLYNKYPTIIKTEGICRNHIIPTLGNKKILSITVNDLRLFQNYCIKNKTPSVAYNTMRTLKKILNWATEWEIIRYNPMKGKLPPEPETEHPTLTMQQLKDIMTNIHGRDKVIISLGVFSGLRIGEIFGLQWNDVNFKDNTIFIERQFSSGIIGPVKTKKSRAIIPLWHPLTRLLQQWKLQCGSSMWIFSGKTNNPLRPERWRQLQWNKIKHKYNLPDDLRFHDLRHSFATILLMQGADKGMVQMLMRHKSIAITMDIYRHILPREASKTLNFFNSINVDKSGEHDILSL